MKKIYIYMYIDGDTQVHMCNLGVWNASIHRRKGIVTHTKQEQRTRYMQYNLIDVHYT